MIAYLKGTILKKDEKSIILKCGDVGYLVKLSENSLSQIQESKEYEFFTYTHVREDALDVFGFMEASELEFFKQLISISGVGPKTAQDIVAMPINDVKASIVNEDPSLISSVPKVGKKIAQRIILELKNKIDMDSLDMLNRSHGSIPKNITEDIVAAIENLGYHKSHITKTLSKLPEDMKDPEEIIKFFLSHA